MKYIVALLVVVAMAVPAFAGQNPEVYAYITTDADGSEASAFVPAPYSAISMYFCLGNISTLEGEGMTVVSFLLGDVMVDCPGVMGNKGFTAMLPGALTIGDPFVAPGATISATECVPGPNVIVGSVDGFYLGGACCFEVLYHGDFPAWVVDCAPIGEVDYYCVKFHGSLGGAVCPEGDPNCPPESPVGDSTWGGIKAMYQ